MSDVVEVKLTRQQASFVRGALLAYRSAIEWVATDLRPRPDINEALTTLYEAKYAIEQAMGMD